MSKDEPQVTNYCPLCEGYTKRIAELENMTPEELLRQKDGSFPCGNGCELVEIGTMAKLKRAEEVIAIARKLLDDRHGFNWTQFYDAIIAYDKEKANE